jgi:hypothetical protein
LHDDEKNTLVKNKKQNANFVPKNRNSNQLVPFSFKMRRELIEWILGWVWSFVEHKDGDKNHHFKDGMYKKRYFLRYN